MLCAAQDKSFAVQAWVTLLFFPLIKGTSVKRKTCSSKTRKNPKMFRMKCLNLLNQPTNFDLD